MSPSITELKVTKHPQDQRKVYGEEVSLRVSATGSGTLLYQWIKDEEDITSEKYHNCDGHDSHTLNISSLLPEHNGSYKCRVSTEYYSVISNAAELKGKQ